MKNIIIMVLCIVGMSLAKPVELIQQNDKFGDKTDKYSIVVWGTDVNSYSGIIKISPEYIGSSEHYSCSFYTSKYLGVSNDNSEISFRDSYGNTITIDAEDTEYSFNNDISTIFFDLTDDLVNMFKRSSKVKVVVCDYDGNYDKFIMDCTGFTYIYDNNVN
jgi:hypothetical protein